MRISILFLISFFCISFLYSQQTTFFRTYGMGLYDVGEVVIPINDTNYIVAGTTNTTGIDGTDMLLFQTNSVGELTWWKNFGGYGIQSAKGAVTAVDGSGYYITGYKNTFDSTGYDIWLVKANLNGNIMWSKTYGGDDWEIAHSINKLPDSTYIIAGETFSFGSGQRDMYIIRINSDGDTLWTRTFGGIADDIAKYVHVDRHDNILIVGNTESFGSGNSDVYLIYLNMAGDTIWTKTFGTIDDDFGYSADMYIDTSNQMSFGIGYTSYYAPDLAQNSYILIIDSALGNNIALKPQLEANPGILDRIKVRYDKPGVFCYVAEYKDSFNNISIIFTNRTYYGLDYSTSNVVSAAGGNESTKPNDLRKTLDNGYIITGFSEYWGPGPTSCFLLKTDTVLMGPNAPIVSIEKEPENHLEVFPNPVEGNYFYINSGNTIKGVKIYNHIGQLIRSYTTNNQVQSLTLEKPATVSGIHIIEILTSNSIICKKIIF